MSRVSAKRVTNDQVGEFLHKVCLDVEAGASASPHPRRHPTYPTRRPLHRRALPASQIEIPDAHVAPSTLTI